MIPTILTRLVLGVITVMTGQIMALTSAWVPGSVQIQGNTFFDTTNNPNPTFYVNTLSSLSLTGAGLRFNANGTMTGITLLDSNSAVGYADHLYPCTSTGGLGGKYPTCVIRSPYTTTGALTSVTLECGGTGLSLTGSGGFVKSTTAPVLSSFNRMNGITINTGATVIQTFTGSTVKKWNPADIIKIGTVTSLPTTTNFNCGARVKSYDLFGS